MKITETRCPQDDRELDNVLLEVTKILLPRKANKLQALRLQQQIIPAAQLSADILPFKTKE
ncbi:hypothetical protein [Thalassospira profundimaris]|uniref:Uncharacterized protein n=1 Tax=Thalassospira profundimaris TaxID=502049 RepID=A0A367WP60_9PROT|nr:hypothetical protein [Thalassospira profundimaris]RCK43243.1 hypothetical protein TH30_19720 [Thalassospira profundimaris]